MFNSDRQQPRSESPVVASTRRSRLHRSTIAVCAAVWLLSVLLLWRGDRMDKNTYSTAGDGQIWEHGWPWTFLSRTVDGPLSRSWWIYDGEHAWFGGALAYDAAVLMAFGLICAGGWELAVRWRTSVLQFGLRTLIVAVTISGLGLGWWQYEVRKGREELVKEKAIRATGSFCEINYVGPLLLRRLFGASNLPGHRITVVIPAYSTTKEEARFIAELRSLSHLETVEITVYNPRVDPYVRALARLDSLPEIEAHSSAAMDATTPRFLSVKGLRRLDLESTKITDASLSVLAGCESLEELDVSWNQTTDGGLSSLPKYPRLRKLDVSGTDVSDAGIRMFLQCPSLKAVDLTGTEVSRDGIAWLKDARPDLSIVHRTYP